MQTILLLFVLGIVLLVLDLFTPGIFLAIGGVLAFLGATQQAFEQFGVWGGLLAFAIGAVLLAVALYIEYGLLPKTRYGKRFFLHTPEHDLKQAAAAAAALVGHEGVALTPLKPTGQIEIDGQRHEARSLDGQIEKGARLKVVGAQNFSLTVTKLP
jgi:membrane-bound serine protease (ClpP class)